MKHKSKCCRKFEKKARVCKKCPLFAAMKTKERKQALKDAAKKLALAA